VTKLAMNDCSLGTLAFPRSLDRARALVGGTSEKATAALEEVARLKVAVNLYLRSKRHLAPATDDDDEADVAGNPQPKAPPRDDPAREQLSSSGERL
jgi:hypothetical protein